MHSLGPIGSAAGFLIACDARTAANRLWPLGFFWLRRPRCISRSVGCVGHFLALAHTLVTRRWFSGNWHAIRRTKKKIVWILRLDLMDIAKRLQF